MIAAVRTARPTTDDDPSLNPYWPRNGATTFVDPDGYRLIISQS